MLRLPFRITPFLAVASLFWPQSLASNRGTAPPARIQAIRFWSFGDVTRIAIQTEGDYRLFSDQIENPPRVYFDLAGLQPPAGPHHGFQTIEVKDRLLKQIRVAEVSPGRTRIVFDLECQVEVVSSQLVNPDRLMIELRQKSQPKPTVSLARSNTRSQKIDLSSPEAGKPTEEAGSPIVVLENKKANAPEIRQSEPARDQVKPPVSSAKVSPPAVAPPANVPDNPGNQDLDEAETPPSPALATHESPPALAVSGPISPAKRNSGGDRSLVRVLGLKLGRVVIDAGHGGHDTGTVGPNGLMEKDLVLDIALRLGKLITKQLGAEVIYTRSADIFIPLEQRTKIANNAKADLFISIHANSSPEPRASGVETFYFNLTSDRVGLDLATRENATSLSSISDLNDLLHKAVLENKLEESREFAQKVQSALWSGSLKMNTQSRDRGVRQAPFVVLIGATMPSILAEIGFVSNPHDERLLRRMDERQKIAAALLKGISQYASTLSHLQLARAGAE
ncbi:MAG TPA: N-acetylmuramoyl-L-alanine amidase [Bryobacteraceae bacterium]|nr:N-acetylmuramoyl-L-alanine amidase [Bryobacteraceae bacterium]